MPASTHVATATLTLVDAPVTTAFSVPSCISLETALEFKVVSTLNDVLSCLLRNPVVPQMPEHIVETVNAIPQEWISELTVDIPVAPTEYVTPLLLVEFTTPAPSVTHVTPSAQLSPLPA